MVLSKSQRFFDQLMIKDNKKGKCKTSLSLAKYNEIVKILRGAMAKIGSKTDEEYKLLRRFDMVAVNGIQKLVKKGQRVMTLSFTLWQMRIFMTE